MSKLWSEAELTTLRAMKADGAGPTEIAATLGRTLKGVSAKIVYLSLTPEMRRIHKQTERGRKRTGKRTPAWTKDQVAAVLFKRDVELKKWDQIALEMNKPLTTCQAQWNKVKYPPVYHERVVSFTKTVVPEPVKRERDHRVNLEPRDLTAAFFGDPPVGYSALERRT